MTERNYLKSFSHIGITFPDINNAVKFYSDVMRWYIIMEPSTVTKENETAYPFHTELFHFCIQDPNIEELIEKIVAKGGKQRMPIRAYFPNEKPFNMCYVEDQFKIVFEIYTHSYELTYSSGAYHGE